MKFMLSCCTDYYKYNGSCVGELIFCPYLTNLNEIDQFKAIIKFTFNWSQFVECPLGTFGKNCTGICVPQYYGKFCQSKCECPLYFCDRKHGCMKFETKSKIKIVINKKKSYIQEIYLLN